MSYQVLARKWRPSKFAELVGQDHVKSALINGLTNQRLHHAYLFSGTRGVGKTSIARIFAKSLNCETGITAEPCGVCPTCVDVDGGRFVDLIEIDAASRTKVGDTREILDNVQYAPSRGRYKIYLIDEVHMLSRHSFNALLKTLEEPPEHVKFLLATTDPQKLPVTILSRCLQFNLQALDIAQIEQQLTAILTAEHIAFEPTALSLIAKFAHGSMRDGLSLTDQAIAQSGENLTLNIVQNMLGTVDIAWSQNVFSAILSGKGERLIEIFSRLEKQRPDFVKVLDDMLMLCHQIAMAQILPAAAKLSIDHAEYVTKVASRIPAAQIQIYYQLLLQGKKDLPLAPDMARGFEMLCLRLLAFKPVETNTLKNVDPNEGADSESQTALKKNSESAFYDSLIEPLPSDDKSIAFAQQTVAASNHTRLDTSVKAVSSQVTGPDATIVTEVDAVQAEEIKDAVDAERHSESSFAVPHLKAEPNTIVAATEPVEDVKISITEQPVQEIEAYQQLSEQASSEQDALLSQQAFYQDLASSQGFSGEYEPATMAGHVDDVHHNHQGDHQHDGFEHSNALGEQDQNELQGATNTSNPALLSDSELENPVMAILASRGVQPGAKLVEQPKNDSDAQGLMPSTGQKSNKVGDPKPDHIEPVLESEPQHVEPMPALKPIEHETVKFAHEVDSWARMIEMSDLAGLGRQLARNGEVVIDGDKIEMTVKKEFAHLLNEKSEAELRDVVSRLSPASNFVINKSEITQMAPADIQKNINMNRQERAEQSISDDVFVQTLVNEFGGKVLRGSINPIS